MIAFVCAQSMEQYWGNTSAHMIMLGDLAALGLRG